MTTQGFSDSRPSGATAIAAAVLALLGGSLALLGLLSFFSLAAQLGMDAAIAASALPFIGFEWWRTAGIANQVANGLTAYLLLGGAIALFRRRSSGRRMIIWGCVVVLASHVVGLLAANAVAQSMGSFFSAGLDDSSDFDALMRDVMLTVGGAAAILMLFPAVTLLLAAAPSTRRWCEAVPGRRTATWQPPDPATRISTGGSPYRGPAAPLAPIELKPSPASTPAVEDAVRKVAGWANANKMSIRKAVAEAPRRLVLADGAAVVLMLLALLLPWDRPRGLVLIVTALAVAAVATPYAVMTSSAVAQTLRTAGIVPYLALLVIYTAIDVVRALQALVNAVPVLPITGPAVWVGLAGGVLALCSRPIGRSNVSLPLAANVIMASAVALSSASALLALALLVTESRVGITPVAVSATGTVHAVIVIALMAVPAIVLAMMAAIGVRVDQQAWCAALAMFAAILLVVGVVCEIFPLNDVRSVMVPAYFSLPLWVCAGAIGVAVLVCSSGGEGATHQGYVWIAACRYVLALVVVWCVGDGVVTAIAQVLTAENLVGLHNPSGSYALVLAALSLIGGVLAYAGVRSLRIRYHRGADPRPQRHMAVLLCTAASFALLLRVVSGGGSALGATLDYAMIGLVAAVPLVITFAPSVRILYPGVPLFRPAANGITVRPSRATADTDALTASNPKASHRELARIAQTRPDLRAVIASNPGTYAQLLEWLRSVDDEDVNRALLERTHVVTETSRIEE